MSNTKYKGWTNYETWLVKLWIDNNEGAQCDWLESARRFLLEAEEVPDPHGIGSTAEQTARYRLAATLKDQHADDYLDALEPHLRASLFSDMLGAAFGSVDWDEIAQSLLDDVAEGVS